MIASLKAILKPKKEIPLLLEMQVRKKIFTQAAANFFFSINSIEFFNSTFLH